MSANRREQLRRQQEAARQRKRLNLIIGLVAGFVALVLIVIFAVVAWQQFSSDRSSAQIVPVAANADANGLVVNESPAPEGAPVVTLYLDYQCPNCRVFEQNFGSMLETEANAGTWTLQFKTMVFMDQNLKNTASTRAALAASCAANQGYYPAYNDTVYQNQAAQEIVGDEGYSDELLRVTIPNTIGMSAGDITTFQQCYDDKATSDFVDAVSKSAYEDGVTGTPTLAVNGKILDLSQLTDSSPEGLKQFIVANA